MRKLIIVLILFNSFAKAAEPQKSDRCTNLSISTKKFCDVFDLKDAIFDQRRAPILKSVGIDALKDFRVQRIEKLEALLKDVRISTPPDYATFRKNAEKDKINLPPNPSQINTSWILENYFEHSESGHVVSPERSTSDVSAANIILDGLTNIISILKKNGRLNGESLVAAMKYINAIGPMHFTNFESKGLASRDTHTEGKSLLRMHLHAATFCINEAFENQQNRNKKSDDLLNECLIKGEKVPPSFYGAPPRPVSFEEVDTLENIKVLPGMLEKIGNLGIQKAEPPAPAKGSK